MLVYKFNFFFLVNCSKTLPQWIGFDDSDYPKGDFLVNDGMTVYPFNAFGKSYLPFLKP